MPARLSPITLRRARLASGLVLFAYVGTHLIDHALGNASLGAMQADLAVQRLLWQGPVGTLTLYGALLVHYALGLRAWYARRDFGWGAGEAAQTVLGLAIPFLLVNHVFATRVALAQFGLVKGYPQELHSFLVARPDLGLVQLALLLVAWTHGCLGLFYVLRLGPAFPRFSPVLLCAAVLVPMLALLGAWQAGRRVVELSREPAWRAAFLAPGLVGTTAEQRALARERDAALLFLAVLFGGVSTARGGRAWREAHGGTIRIAYPDGRVVRVPRGFSVLDASRAGRIPHPSLCGGRARCSTCRVRVLSGHAPSPAAGEQAVLDRIGAGPGVRLACQLRPLSDMAVRPPLPPSFALDDLRRRRWPRAGEERFVVVLVADLRQSMALSASHLPFDAVFLVGRFVAAVAEAVALHGGLANQFTGDGVLAIFGLDAPPDKACRQAVEAIDAIGARVASLNASLAAEGAALAYGIGVHGGLAVVGEIMLGSAPIFTTLGEVAGIATRLEQLSKECRCEAVISDLVWRRAGRAHDEAPVIEAALRGGAEPLPVRLIRPRRPRADAGGSELQP